MNRPTRSLVLAGRVAVLGLLALGVAACGGSGEGATSTTTTAATPGADGEAPELGRVVALGEEFLLADLLSLGVTPIASTATVADAGFSGLDDFDTTGIEVLANEPNFEHLSTLEPDTFLVQQYVVDQVGADELEAMGDVIVVPTGTGPDELTELGAIVGREDEATELIEELLAAQTEATETAGDGCEVSLATIYPGPTPAAWVSAPNNVAIALQDLNCTLVPSADDAAPDGAGRVYLSLEELGQLSAPQLILLQSSDVEGEDASLAEVEDDPLWQQLPSVQADQVTVMDRLGYPGVAGLTRLYQELAEHV